MNIDGFMVRITGRTGNRLVLQGANQLIIGYKNEKYIKKLAKFVERAGEKRRSKEELKVNSRYDKITAEENLELYDAYLDKLKNSLYSKRLASQIAIFEAGREKFIRLSIENQCELLVNALNMFGTKGLASDTRLIGGSASAGLLVMSKTLKPDMKIKIVNQSITGMFDNERDINKK